jgi:uncharacterized damage-inducible protein DinB
MFNAKILSDIHHRSHQTLQMLMAHCRSLTPDELNREIEEYGDPTVQLQLHHVISAERYWIGVLEGRMDVDEDQAEYPTVEALEAFREEIFALGESYLKTASDEELSTPRSMMTWRNKERILVPAHVFLRTQMHLYHHHGKISAMCRRMGKPIAPGMDYPITVL